MEKLFEKAGILIPNILLPNDSVSMEKWATVAVDQFTSEPMYWSTLEKIVGDAPSTLNLVMPECYLETEKEKTHEETIKKSMETYPETVLTKTFNGLVVVKRKMGKLVRTGVVVAIDLEKYDFRPEVKANIKATEKTVLERIPPRVKIRKAASIELPHILLLINDPSKTAIETLEKASTETLYDFDLSMEGGHITGKAVTDEKAIETFCDKLASILPFAVGDGNHSFASAKAYWEELKARGAKDDHPARFALCEIENIYDEGIVFEPIHRVLFNIDFDEFIDGICTYYGEDAGFAEDFDLKYEEPTDDTKNAYHSIKVITENRTGTLYVDKKRGPLAVGILTDYLSTIDVKVDYVHNLKNTKALAKDGNVGILLPAMAKSELFNVVDRGEVLPKKTFSMGCAESKRYYLEARKIREV